MNIFIIYKNFYYLNIISIVQKLNNVSSYPFDKQYPIQMVYFMLHNSGRKTR